MTPTISGAHVLLYSTDAEADRAFLRDVLGFAAVDAGGGWLIFALPPAEVAVHPLDGDSEPPAAGANLAAELYLMCDDLHAVAATLAAPSRGSTTTTTSIRSRTAP